MDQSFYDTVKEARGLDPTIPTPNVTVEILDLETKPFDFDLSEYLKGRNPDIVGLTGASLVFPRATEIAHEVRQELPESLLIVGGVHITATARFSWQPFMDTFSNTDFDMALLGRGEEMFAALIMMLQSGKDLDQLPSVFTKKNAHLKQPFQPHRPGPIFTIPFTQIPSPAMAFDLLEPEDYRRLNF